MQYLTHSGCRLNKALLGWIYTTWLSTSVLYPSWGSFLAAFLKNPEQIAFCTLTVFFPADTTSNLCLQNKTKF